MSQQAPRLAATVVAAALVAPALQPPLERFVGGFATAFALLPLALALALTWQRLSPPTAPVRVPVVLAAAVLVSGPVLACLLALVLRRPVVLPHPLVVGETMLLAAVEELLFHGVLLALGLRLTRRWLSPTLSATGVVLGLAAVFALAHPGLGANLLASRFWAAVLAGLLVLATGRLLSAITLHAGFNLYAYVATPLVSPSALLGIGALWSTAAAPLLVAHRLRSGGGHGGRPRRRRGGQVGSGGPSHRSSAV